MSKINLASDDNFTYCYSCGARYKKKIYKLLPISIKFNRRFSFGAHGFQVGYTFGLVPVFSKVIRFGWVRIILGHKSHQGGIGCYVDKNHGVVVRHDTLVEIPESFEDYLKTID